MIPTLPNDPVSPRPDVARLRIASLAVLSVLVGGLLGGRSLLAWREGPPAGRVGACGFGPTCRDSGCHSSYLVTDTPQIWDLHVESPAPAPLPPSYVPGAAYGLRLDVRDMDPNASVWGFQLAALMDCPVPSSAGSIVPADLSRTRLVTGGMVVYWEHSCLCATEDPSCCGYVPDQAPGQNGWNFAWTAPPRASGQVMFTLAINAANWDGTPLNDRIYVAEIPIEEELCPPAIADLLVGKSTCDPGSPGEVRVDLTWTSPGTYGPDVVRSAEPATLAAPRETWTLEAGSCLPIDGRPLVFYSVAPPCELGSEGPH